MKQKIHPPLFEVGPKAYLYGNDMLELARHIDELAKEYDVNVIVTPQNTDIFRIADETENLMIFAQHIDPIVPGRGQGSVLAEAVKAAGAHGVMLNHAEKPISLADLRMSIIRANECGLLTMVCADSIAEARMIAQLSPDIIVCEPTELIGTGQVSDESYVKETMDAIKAVNPDIIVLQGAGISNGDDVFRVILAGADATGTTSGIMKAKDKPGMAREMISAVRQAWDAR